MNSEEKVDQNNAPLLKIEAVIDLRLLLPQSADLASVVPAASTIEGLAKITNAFPDKTVFIALCPSTRHEVMKWLLMNDLFRQLGVTPERFLFFRRRVDIQHFLIAATNCHFVVSGNRKRLSRLAGLRVKRFLLTPRQKAVTIHDGLMRGAIRVPDYDVLSTTMLSCGR